MRRALIVYVVLIHAVAALVLWKSDFIDRVEKQLSPMAPADEISHHHKLMLAFHLRTDELVPDRAVAFVGDSLIQGLHTDAVASPSVNYGIAGDTTVGVLARVPVYRSLRRAAVIVMAVGVNDIKFRANDEIVLNYRRILQTLEPSVPLVMAAVLPVDESVLPSQIASNDRIRDLNVSLSALCRARARCLFADAGAKLVDARGNLSAVLHDWDGLHLNNAGNRIWAEVLQTAIKTAQSM